MLYAGLCWHCRFPLARACRPCCLPCFYLDEPKAPPRDELTACYHRLTKVGSRFCTPLPLQGRSRLLFCTTGGVGYVGCNLATLRILHHLCSRTRREHAFEQGWCVRFGPPTRNSVGSSGTSSRAASQITSGVCLSIFSHTFVIHVTHSYISTVVASNRVTAE